MTTDPGTGIALVRELASAIGPRRPGSRQERAAADFVLGWLVDRGLQASTEPFRAPPTFAWAQAIPIGLALAARAREPDARDRVLGAVALIAGAAEADPRWQPFTRLTSRERSQNVVAVLEPSGAALRTLCLVSHLDTSRSGLLFHPDLAPRLRGLINASSVALTARCAAALLGGRSRVLRWAGQLSSPMLWAALALLAERELRGQDVPGANDNASGVAVAATVAAELVSARLESTRVVFLATGAEESGTVGMRAFLQSRDTAGWLFLNLDGVGAPGTLRYLAREGVGRTWPADEALLKVAEQLTRRRPELGLARQERLVGLTYDATQVLARGGRALTLSAQDDTIPNYHTPGDTPENIDRDVLSRATEIVREVVAAVDRGEADPIRG